MKEFFEKNPIVRDAMILTIITLVAGIALGLVYEVTKAPIAAAQEAARQAAYREVFSDAATFEEMEGFDSAKVSKTVQKEGYADDDITQCLVALDGSGNPLGYVITVVTHAGYGGNITFSVGIKNDGTINGYSITDISETAGLGMKATENDFMKQFKGIPVAVYEVTKSTAGENEIEAISGATITSRAVTNGVNAAVSYFNSLGGASGDAAAEGGEANE